MRLGSLQRWNPRDVLRLPWEWRQATWTRGKTDVDTGRLRTMRAIVRSYQDHPVIRAVALRVLRLYGCPSRDRWAQARALQAWVQSEIVWTAERGDLWFSPLRSIWLGAGDCDDQALVLASLAESIKLPSRFSALRKNGRAFHVFVCLRLPAARSMAGFGRVGESSRRLSWVPAETSLPVPLGWDPCKATPGELRRFRG